MRFNPERVQANITGAETDDLLDRATLLRDGMEAEALPLIEAELRRRGVTAQQIDAHEEKRRGEVILREDNLPARCSLCTRPALTSSTAWHKLWGLVPLFRRRFYHCEQHRPRVKDDDG